MNEQKQKALNKVALLATADLTKAEVALRKIANDDPGQSFVPVVMEKLRRGEYKLALITAKTANAATDNIGVTIWSVDEFPGGWRELVSIATKINAPGDWRFAIEAALIALAKDSGCRSMRMHTVRHGLIWQSLSYGWNVSEVVIRKYLA